MAKRSVWFMSLWILNSLSNTLGVLEGTNQLDVVNLIARLNNDRSILQMPKDSEQLEVSFAERTSDNNLSLRSVFGLRQERSTVGNDVTVSVDVSQEKNYRVLRWQPVASNLTIINFKIYRSFSVLRILDVNNMEEVDLVSGSTTEWHDKCTTYHSIVRYAVTAIDSTGKEHKHGVETTAPLYMFGSFEPLADVQYIFSPWAKCCVLCSDVVFNPDKEQYLYVYDCDGNQDGLAEGVYAILLDNRGRPVTNAVALTLRVTAPFVQGCPCAAYNPNTTEYLVVFEVKTPQYSGNRFFLVSQRLDSFSLQKAHPPVVALGFEGQVDVRQCHLAFNPKTNGYAVVAVEYSSLNLSRTELGYISSNGRIESMEVLHAQANSQRPRVLYDTNTDSLVIVCVFDRLLCAKDTSKCANINTNRNAFISFRQRSANPNERLPQSIRNHVFVVGYAAAMDTSFSTYFQYGNNIDCIGVCFDVETASDHSTASSCTTHCSRANERGWNWIHSPAFCQCGEHFTSGASVSFRKGKGTFMAVWEEKTSSGHRLNGHFLNPSHFNQNIRWADQRSPQVVYNNRSDAFCVFWKYSSGCATCYKTAVRCFTPSTKCTDPCCCSDLPSCEFSCSSCNEYAKCIPQKRKCNCHKEFIGDGKFCCPKGIGTKTAVLGGSAVFKCDDSCRLDRDSEVKWYHNWTSFASSDNRKSISTDGRWLSVDPVGRRSSGDYICEIRTKSGVYQRKGVLRVLQGKDIVCHCGSDCGRSCARQQRIHNGRRVLLGKYPWMGMLCDRKSNVFCGAVLVSCHCVVTAAHCVLTNQGIVKKVSDFSICFNKRCRSRCEVPTEKNSNNCFRAKEIIIHPQYDNDTFDSDIAVIKLEGSVVNDCSTVSPVCLPYGTSEDQDAVQPRVNAVVIGYGMTIQDGNVSKCLKEGIVQIVSASECEKYRTGRGKTVTTNMLCATDDNGACEGDSGGPLLVRNAENEDRWTLAGIVSWGNGCGQKDSYGGYANVPRLAGFVRGTCGLI